MEPNIQFYANESTASYQDQLVYQHAIGKTMYTMLATRPDLAYTISALSSYYSNPSPWHSIAVLRLLRYLKTTLEVGITYKATQDTKDSQRVAGLVGYTDSDWAGDKDTRRSTLGYIFTLYGGAISWKSSKQSLVATSSTEAEYIACSDGAKEALWLRRLMLEIRGTPSTTSMYYNHKVEVLSQLRTLYTTSIPRTLHSSNPQTLFVDNQGAIKLS